MTSGSFRIRVFVSHFGHRVNPASRYGLRTNKYRGGNEPMRALLVSRFDFIGPDSRLVSVVWVYGANWVTCRCRSHAPSQNTASFTGMLSVSSVETPVLVALDRTDEQGRTDPLTSFEPARTGGSWLAVQGQPRKREDTKVNDFWFRDFVFSWLFLHVSL